MDNSQGLYEKYCITKTDGSLIDPNAQYFVLRVDTDPHARLAMRVYAYSIVEENVQLAEDIFLWMDGVLGK